MENKVICFGEVLWDVLGNSRLIGGAPLNVCYHLSKQGISSKIVSQVGGDIDGVDLKEGIRKLGVDTDFISISEIHPTSKVLVNMADHGKVSYQIVENVAWDFVVFDEQIAREISLTDCFVYGSLITRNAVSSNTLLKYLQYANWKVLDLNLRQPYYDKEIINKLLSTCNTLKINDEELTTITSLFSLASNNQQELMTEILRTFSDIKEIIVTKGADGAVYHSREETIEVGGIKVNVVDTVGSGDSFLAAYIASKLNNKPVYECLQNAISLSAFIATQQGACPIYNDDTSSNI